MAAWRLVRGFGMAEAAKTRVELQPGETVQQVIRTTETLILRRAAVATALAGLLFYLIAQGDAGFESGRFLISILLFGLVMLGAGFALDRGREWVLTNRRIIAPGGRSLELNSDLRIRRLAYALKLSQRGRPGITIRAVPELGALVTQIRDLALRAPQQ